MDPAPNALKGEFRLLANDEERPALTWSVEAWRADASGEARWVAESSSGVGGHRTLASSLRAVAGVARDLEPQLLVGSPLEAEAGERPPIQGSSLAGVLGYGLVQWTEPLQLRYASHPKELLGVLYRVDRWIVHDRLAGRLWLIAPRGLAPSAVKQQPFIQAFSSGQPH